jgi:hypothetical protein
MKHTHTWQKWIPKAEGVREGYQLILPQQVYGSICMQKQKIWMPLWAEMKTTTIEG